MQKKDIKIMIVEDNVIVAMELSEKLTSEGFSVVGETISGEEAVQMAADRKPNVILMDIKLDGDLDGVSAAKKINNELSIPIIYTTAYSDMDTIQKITSVSEYGYLIKPYDYNDLFLKIEIALGKR